MRTWIAPEFFEFIADGIRVKLTEVPTTNMRPVDERITDRIAAHSWPEGISREVKRELKRIVREEISGQREPSPCPTCKCDTFVHEEPCQTTWYSVRCKNAGCWKAPNRLCQEDAIAAWDNIVRSE